MFKLIPSFFLMRAAVLVSGGKDSIFSLHMAKLWGFDVRVMISIQSSPDSPLFHTIASQALPAISSRLGLPLIIKHASDEINALYDALFEAKRRYSIDAVFTGALASEFQRFRFEDVFLKLGLKSYNPIWHLDPKHYMNILLNSGFKILIVKTTALGLKPDIFLGKLLTPQLINKIFELSDKFGFNPAFEGGEAETLVVDAPLYSAPLWVEFRENILNDFEGYLDIRVVE